MTKSWFRPRAHGMGGTRVYNVWAGMKNRCFNEKSERYKDYGARGITVCERWMKFENFFADMGHPPKNHTLERKDNNGPYSPGNCVWATMHAQTRNRSSNVIISFQGESMCLKDWSAKLGIHYLTLWRRYKDGWETPRLFKSTGRIKS